MVFPKKGLKLSDTHVKLQLHEQLRNSGIEREDLANAVSDRSA